MQYTLQTEGCTLIKTYYAFGSRQALARLCFLIFSVSFTVEHLQETPACSAVREVSEQEVLRVIRRLGSS